MKDVDSSDTKKSTAEVTELCKNCAEHLQKKECTIVEGNFSSTAKKTQETGKYAKNIK